MSYEPGDAIAAWMDDSIAEREEDDAASAGPLPTPDDERDSYERAERLAIEATKAVRYLGAELGYLPLGSVGEMSAVYARVVESIETMTTIKDLLANAIGSLMSEDMTVIDGVGGFERSRRNSIRWDNDGVRSLVRRQVLGTVADPETGEIAPEAVSMIDRAMEMITSVYSLSSPKVGGLRALDADPDEYRTVDRLGYRIKFIPSTTTTDGF